MKHSFLIFLLLFNLTGCTHEKRPDEPAAGKEPSLTEQLAARAQKSAEKAPRETRQIMIQAIQDLKASEVMETALKKGDKIPLFELNDVQKGLVRSSELLKQGPLLITFYRGGWCPYCNLQLRDLQKNLEEIRSTGAQLVAISPESPDASAKTVEEQDIDYYVLSDEEAKVGQQFGLMFKINDELKSVYEKFGIHLDKVNANKKWELPLAATYIVKQDGTIVHAFVEADYKKRAETRDLNQILKDL